MPKEQIMIKTLKNLVICLGLSLMLATSGCVTPGQPGPTPAQIDAAALVLKNATRATLVLVIVKNGEKGREYVGLAKDSLALFVAGTDHSVAALASRLSAIPLGGLSQAEASLIVLILLTTYDIFLGGFIRDGIGRSEIALKALTALRDGCAEALVLTQPPV